MLKQASSIVLIIGLMTFAQSALARSHHRHHPHYTHHHQRYDHHTAHRNFRAHHIRGMRLRRYRASSSAELSVVADGAQRSPLVQAAMRHFGSRNFTGRRGPWCGFAMNAFAREAGLPAIQSGRAIDWRRYGRPSGPQTGAIAVFRHHVGVVTGMVGSKIQIISGNHGGRVGLGLYSMSRVVAFRSS